MVGYMVLKVLISNNKKATIKYIVKIIHFTQYSCVCKCKRPLYGLSEMYFESFLIRQIGENIWTR